MLSFFFMIIPSLKKNALAIFLTILVVFPFSNAFSSVFYKNGLYIYDYFILSSAFILLFNSIFERYRPPRSIVFTIFPILFFYFFIGLYEGVDKYYLRDLRLVIYVLYIYILSFATIFWGRLTVKNILFVILAASISNVIFVVLSMSGFFNFDDQYYVNHSFRYFDLSTHIASIFLIFGFKYKYKISGNDRLFQMCVIASVLSVLSSGSRMIVSVTFLLFIIKNHKYIFSRFYVGALIFTLFTSIAMFTSSELIERLLNVSFDTVVAQIYVRYSPFINEWESFELFNVFFGAGIGSVFNIPWFEYRSENLDVYSNFIDTTYLTLYYKFGFFSILYFIAIIKGHISCLGCTCNFEKSIIFFILILYMTVFSLPFQASSIGLLIGCYLINSLSNSYK